MSYQVLARQWRPRTFAEVVGQQHVLQALSNALRHQRLHHAYLLSGTCGVGKTTIARILSRSLNCETGITPEPCGVCDACTQIDEGRFVDLLEIDAASRTKVEDTREILENVQYRPTSGRYKVYLIDEVHMLSRHSFNALLKTLEEPPPHAIFLLATTEPDKLPVTVLSRCLQFNLRALTREEISGQLGKVLSAEQIPFDQGALDLLARAARGSMRDGLSLTDQAIAQGDRSVTEQGVAVMLGSLDPRDNIALLNYIAHGDIQQALQHLRTLPDRMTDISDVLSELQNLLHQLALTQLAPGYVDSGLVSHKEGMQALAQLLAPEQIQVWYRMILEGRRELPLATDAFAAVEMTLLRLLSFRPVMGEQQALPQQAAVQVEAVAQPEQPNFTEPTPANIVDENQQLAQQQEQIIQQAAQMQPAVQQEQPQLAPEPAAQLTPSVDESDPLASLLATRDLLAQPPGQQAKQQPTTTEPPLPPKVEPAPEQQVAAPEQLTPAIELTEPAVTLTTHKRRDFTPDVRVAADVDAWSASIAGLEPQGLVRQLLLHSLLTQDENNSGYVLTIDQMQQTLATDQTEHNVATELRRLIGDAPLSIVFGAVADTPFLIQQEIDSYRLGLAEQYVAQHSGIQALQETFAAEVIPGSIQPRD